MTDLQQIKQAYIAADADNDSLLNREEFANYVSGAYGKAAPPEMFDSLCEHFQHDPELGIDWKTAKRVWKHAQTAQHKKPVHMSPAVQELKQIFDNADKDEDGYLKQIEFIEFAKIGFKKSHIPAQMYNSVCVMFNKDPQIGIDWESAFDLWKKSNPDTKSDDTYSSKTNTKPVGSGLQTYSRQPRQVLQQRRSKTPNPPMTTHDRHHPSESLPFSGYMPLTKENLIKHTILQSERSILYTPSDNGLYFSARNGCSHKHGMCSTNNFDARPAIKEMDVTAMAVQIMDNKLKQTTKSYQQERRKRKRLEEMTQTLLNSNEQYEQTIADLKQKQCKLQAENQRFKYSMCKLKAELEDDRQTIQHLRALKNTIKKERDQSFILLARMEAEYNQKTKSY